MARRISYKREEKSSMFILSLTINLQVAATEEERVKATEYEVLVDDLISKAG